VILASVKELAQAYLQALEKNNVNEALFWREHLTERLELLLDTVGRVERTARVDGDEPERGGGAL